MKDEEMERILHEYDQALRYVAYRYVKNWVIVDDIMQDVYLKVFLKFDTFEGRAQLKSWLHRITVNQSIDYIRSSEQKSTFLSENPEEFSCVNTLSAEDTMIDKVERDALRDRIRKLPGDYEVTLSLYYFNDYSYKEIGMLLSKDITYVKNRLFRGRRLLKKIYQTEKLCV